MAKGLAEVEPLEHGVTSILTTRAVECLVDEVGSDALPRKRLKGGVSHANRIAQVGLVSSLISWPI
jgi:hypothetical protein